MVVKGGRLVDAEEPAFGDNEADDAMLMDNLSPNPERDD